MDRGESCETFIRRDIIVIRDLCCRMVRISIAQPAQTLSTAYRTYSVTMRPLLSALQKWVDQMITPHNFAGSAALAVALTLCTSRAIGAQVNSLNARGQAVRHLNAITSFQPRVNRVRVQATDDPYKPPHKLGFGVLRAESTQAADRLDGTRARLQSTDRRRVEFGQILTGALAGAAAGVGLGGLGGCAIHCTFDDEPMFWGALAGATLLTPIGAHVAGKRGGNFPAVAAFSTLGGAVGLLGAVLILVGGDVGGGTGYFVGIGVPVSVEVFVSSLAERQTSALR